MAAQSSEPPTKATLKTNLLRYGVIACWGVVAIAATTTQGLVVRQWERQTQTWFTRVRGSVSPPPDIVILAIDEDSIAQGQYYSAYPNKYPYLAPFEAWPWRRSVYGDAAAKLLDAGALSVGIDVIFTTPSIYGPEDDRAFQQSLARYANRIVLAITYAEAKTDESSTTQLEEITPNLVTKPQRIGFINTPLEADNRIHNLGTVYLNRAIKGSGLPEVPSFQQSILATAGITYPHPKGDGIFFYGPSRTFTTIPFWQVIDPESWSTFYNNGAFFKGKIVLIGPTASELQDFQATPSAEKMPGIEVHANAIASLIEGRTLQTVMPNPLGQGVFVLVIMTAATGLLILLPERPLVPLVWGLGCAGVWAMVSYGGFTYAGLIVPTAIPILALLGSGASNFTIEAIRNQVEKLRLRHTLERYVSPAIAQEILNQPNDYQAQLRGRKISAAVMFCDIRSFTTLSFQMAPEELVALLNVYLSAMVDVIISERGTIDKYIGDAIMAEFGAPVSLSPKEDAMCSIRAALGMRQALANLRTYWEQNGQEPLYNGIGISYGDVIAGNIGSIKRSEYTVIGDTVNIASRVEGLNKTLCTDILITESLYELVKDDILVEYMGEQAIRGRSAVKLYAVMALKNENPKLYYEIRAELRDAKDNLKTRLGEALNRIVPHPKY